MKAHLPALYMSLHSNNDALSPSTFYCFIVVSHSLNDIVASFTKISHSFVGSVLGNLIKPCPHLASADTHV
jgi:hypothetical protein